MRRHMVSYFPIKPQSEQGRRNKVEATGKEKLLARDAVIVGAAVLSFLSNEIREEISVHRHQESTSILVQNCSIYPVCSSSNRT